MDTFSGLVAKIENWSKKRHTLSEFDGVHFCGYDSLPIRLFEIAAAERIPHALLVTELKQVVKLLEPLSKNKILFQQATGITHACIAACHQLEESEREKAFHKAVECIAEAMPDLPASQQDKRADADEWERTLLDRCLQSTPKNLGAAVAVIDLIRRLGKPDFRPDNDHTVETPVLFRIGREEFAEGFVGILRVELLEDGIVGITPDLAVLGANVIHTPGNSDLHNLHKSVIRIWELAGLKNCRARWSVRPFQSDDEKNPRALKLEYLDGRSMEAALLVALWAANGGIPGDDYQSKTAFRMEPKVAVSGMVTSVKRAEPGSFEIDAVDGVRSKLVASEKLNLDAVVLAAHRTGSGEYSAAAKDREEVNSVFNEREIRERQNAERQRERGAVGNTEQLYSLTVTRLETARQVFDALLVTNRWLDNWQKQTRYNWLKRWEARSEGNPGARAPGDDERGPDDDNHPKVDVANAAVVTDESATSAE